MNCSFIHRGGPQMASYRYRAANPAKELGASVNDMRAQVLIFAKPLPGDVELAKLAKQHGRTVIVDVCDDHLSASLYQEMIGLADAVTCPTQEMLRRLAAVSGTKRLLVVPDAYEWPEKGPHCRGTNCLWFGNKTNLRSIKRHDMPCRIVSNADGCIPWSMETMEYEFALADIALMPATDTYKSPNRTIEAIRQGCFVVAEPHPSITDFPIYIGDLKEGIEWSKHNDANSMIRRAQEYVSQKYSPRMQASAWKRVLEPYCTSDAARSDGLAGLALT